MRELVISLFGVYEPIMTAETVVTVVDGVDTAQTVDVVAAGMAGVDWPWIFGVLLFAICLYSFFRIVGCLIK